MCPRKHGKDHATFKENSHFDVHAVSVGPLVVDVLVDLDVRHVRVLDVEGRPLRNVAAEARRLAHVQLLRLVVGLAQLLVLVLPHVDACLSNMCL